MPDVAGRSPGWWVRRFLSVGLVVATLVATANCGALTRQRPPWSDAQRVLDRQARAVAEADPDGYLRTVDPASPTFRGQQRRLVRNLLRLPLTDFAYRVTAVRTLGDAQDAPGRVQVTAELRYRLRGYDRAPVRAREELTLVERRGRWYLTAPPAAAPQGTRQLWEQGDLTVVRGRHSLVLGVGRGTAALRALAAQADRAVPAVAALWPHDWEHRVVVEAPATLRDMAELLDGSAASYRGIAAVTTGQASRSASVPADRIVINPEAYEALGEDARQVVLTHEATHVATRRHTSASTPMWLSEGFADWAGYRGAGHDPGHGDSRLVRARLQRIARALTPLVHRQGPPRRLPSDADFAFSGTDDRLGRAYEGGWLACRMIADQWGADTLVRFYTAVGAVDGAQRHEQAVAAALRRVLGLTLDEFTARWRSYLLRQLG